MGELFRFGGGEGGLFKYVGVTVKNYLLLSNLFTDLLVLFIF